MFKKTVFTAALAASFAGNSYAQEMVYPDTIVILDASNSMWGQIDGVAKTTIAREVIAELVDNLETDSEFGLMAFGHRRTSDCGDIELILPVGPLDSPAFSTAVNSITPHGRTPLTASIREAARILNTDERSGRIIIISDGIESCEADPCALTQELEESGLDFTAHVIGFDLADTIDQRQLSCIAENTGGLYRTANSTMELKDELQTMMMDDDMEGHSEITDPEAWITAPTEVDTEATIFINWAGPSTEGDFIAIAQTGQPATSFDDSVLTENGSPIELTAPQTGGVYEIRYISADQNTILATDTITVRDK